MEIKDFIKFYDNTLPPEVISSFIKYVNKEKFQDAGVVGTKDNPNVIDKTTRNVQTYILGNVNTMSHIHWTNLFLSVIKKFVGLYENDLKVFCRPAVERVINIDVLKYEEGGHYVPHVDHGHMTPRSLSVIYFLNNDYQGGELHFTDPQDQNKSILKVEPVPGRMIVWPSNFVFPHGVSPVKKGKRFVIVSWLL